MLTRTLASFVILLLIASSPMFAQPATGFPPFGSFSGGGGDAVDNANLDVHLSVPVISKAGRGVPFAYSLSFDSSVWVPVTSGSSKAWAPVSNWGWSPVTSADTGWFTYTTLQEQCVQYYGPPVVYYYWNAYYNFTYFDPSGTAHPVPNLQVNGGQSGTCGYGGGNNASAQTTDGSGYTITAQASGTGMSAYATDASGTSYFPMASPGLVEDSNGNYVSFSTTGSTTTFTDTLGTTALTAVSGNPTKLSYTNPQGGTSYYYVYLTSKTVQTAFGCSGISEFGPTAVNLVTSISRPDGTSYSFTYEATPGHPNNVTGRIASITLPTGGTINYTYSGGNNGITCADGTTATLTRQTPDGTWTYAHTEPTSPSPWTTTITDPQGGVTSLSFQGTQASGVPVTNALYEVQRTVNLGSNGTLTVNTCYNGSPSPCTTTAVATPITQVAVTRTAPSTTTSSVQSKTVSSYNNPTGLIAEVDEYDYGTSSTSPQPGNLVRKTTTSYANLGQGILNRPSQVTVYNSGGGVAAQTNYSYDQTGTVATSGTPQHIAGYTVRGNPTTIQQWSSSSASLSRTYTYFDTGNVQTATDINGAQAQTTYTYGACGNSFVTNIALPPSLPVSLSTQATWNCTGGVLTSTTDANGKTTTTNYTDANFWRPTSTVDPTNATTTVSYAVSPFAVERALNFNGTTSTVDGRTTLDGLGRTHVSQQKQSQTGSNYDSVETDYDSVGRPARVTVPYQAAAGGTNSSAPATTTTYDALNRPLVVTDGGGGTTTYAYNQNDVLVTVGPAPSGENTKRRQLEYDGLGRLTSVCEIITTGSGTCGQNVAQNGFWTKYTYDTLNNLHTVTQNAQSSSTQTRTFLYDWLSRKTSEQTPETSQVAYSLTYDTDSTCGTSSGDLVKRIDPVGNTICYAYDALHRVTALTYPSGSYSGVTPAKHYVYDSATVNGTAMANAKGRLAEASTGSSKTTDLGFSYSARGDLTDVYQSSPNSGGYYHTNAAYWANGLVNTLSVPGLSTFTYNPDGEGRINSVQAGSAYLVSSTQYNNYQSGWLPQVVTLGSADSDTMTFDTNTGRTTQYKATINGSSATGSLTWNSNGSLGQLQISDPFNSANSQTCTYARGDVSRISKVDCGSGNWGQTFSYDAFGNITKTQTESKGTSFSPGYSSTTNQMLCTGCYYDANGNLTQDGTSGNKYTWDAEGLLSTFNGGTALVYDALGRRVEQTNASGTREILYGPDGSKLALMNGQAIAQAFIGLSGGTTAVYSGSTLGWYRHPDWLGSSRIASTPNRTVYYDGEASYSPFGESPTETGNIDHNFTGQNQDLTSVLYDFPAREYHPGEGRWISPDPAGAAAADPTLPQSWNRYAYVMNDPMTNVDPDGLMHQDENGNWIADPKDFLGGGGGSTFNITGLGFAPQGPSVYVSYSINPSLWDLLPLPGPAGIGNGGSAAAKAPGETVAAGNPQRLVCGGTAYVLAGNPANVGKQGFLE
jgi:RHS repeat-associated protein